METVEGISRFLEFVAGGLATEPEDVKVTRRMEDGAFIFDLHLDEEDIPRMIGKSGGTVNAVRGLAQAAGAREGLKVGVEIAG